MGNDLPTPSVPDPWAADPSSDPLDPSSDPLDPSDPVAGPSEVDPSSDPSDPSAEDPSGGGAGRLQLMEASPWWWAFRGGAWAPGTPQFSQQGEARLRDLLKQLLLGLAALHEANITHR